MKSVVQLLLTIIDPHPTSRRFFADHKISSAIFKRRWRFTTSSSLWWATIHTKHAKFVILTFSFKTCIHCRTAGFFVEKEFRRLANSLTTLHRYWKRAWNLFSITVEKKTSVNRRFPYLLLKRVAPTWKEIVNRVKSLRSERLQTHVAIAQEVQDEWTNPMLSPRPPLRKYAQKLHRQSHNSTITRATVYDT